MRDANFFFPRAATANDPTLGNHPLTFWEVISPKSRGWLRLEALSLDCWWSPAIPDFPRPVTASLQSLPPSAHGLLCASCILSSYRDRCSHKDSLAPECFHLQILNNYICQRSHFQICSYSEFLCSHKLRQNTIQPTPDAILAPWLPSTELL